MDRLNQRGLALVNVCTLCAETEEMGPHLLVCCRYFFHLWTHFVRLFELHWMSPPEIQGIISAWKLGSLSKKGTAYDSLLGTMERKKLAKFTHKKKNKKNLRNFEEKSLPMEALIKKIERQIMRWMSSLKLFVGVGGDYFRNHWHYIGFCH
uniref:Reverse transcriptase zinc-binding domain-containing protein n=1 Tax=Nelumbo nucifera TaxID=4432 RepID=A0A822ZW22_NELNU|nr:TPA_asm: hypothetical protein HUJ06_017406 [Nelumbo nucifera]